MQVSYVVGIVVIFLFSVIFLTLFVIYFKARKKNIQNCLEDDSIYLEIEEDKKRFYKKKNNKYSFIESKRNDKNSDKKFTFITNIILDIIYVGVFLLLIVSLNLRSDNNQIWFGDTSLMVVETSSMAEIYGSNTYLEENGLEDDSYRIPQYALVAIDKNPEKLSDIHLYEVIIFTMYDSTTKTDINVIHRVIQINTDTSGNVVSYTTRGDANPSSLTGETEIPANTGSADDRIFAVFGGYNATTGEIYQGFQNLILGFFIVYLQSAIGIITVAIAILVMVLYSIFYDKIITCYDIRYDELLIGVTEIEDSILTEDQAKDKQVADLETILVPTICSTTGVNKPLLILNSISHGRKKNEYMYLGKMLKKEIVFSFDNKNIRGRYDGYILSNEVKNLFEVSDSVKTEENKDAIIITSGPESYLKFIGDEDQKYFFVLKIVFTVKGKAFLSISSPQKEKVKSIYGLYPFKG
ncbi:MAG: hypothetical protein WCR67_04870 [Bacilli bacterium]